MSSLFILLLGIFVFYLGYRFYARLISGLFSIDPSRSTPAVSRYDGVDFVPAKNWLVLFGHHFSSIAGAGPIIGPVIGCIYWGWMPSLLWVVLGTVFIGGVHDFVALMISVREQGNSVADIAKHSISKKAKIIFSVFVWLALILVIAVFVFLCAKTFVTETKIILPSLGLIPVAVLVGFMVYVRKLNLAVSTVVGLGLLALLLFIGERMPIDIGSNALLIWTIILLAYCFLASITPVNILLQPRDYLCAFLLIFGAAVGLLGVLISRPVIHQPAFVSWQTKEGMLWPMMCVTIACGAISGFHSLIASGTTSKQLANERHARRIGYGSMVAEGIVALLAILAVVSGINMDGVEVCSLLDSRGPICVFGTGYAGLSGVIVGQHGMFIAIMILNAFILTTLDTATRVCRYITEELMGIGNRYVSTFIVVSLAGVLAISGAWNKIWPVFGASNQLVAALALFVASCWLMTRKKPVIYTLLPAGFMFITTITALTIQFFGYMRESNYILSFISIVLVILAFIMLHEVRHAFIKSKGSSS